ncbi:MAG TPA: ADP-ribosylglycohydrolase family protein [Longimicrobium sp.]|nr:ADP-ribosylglycohydrolase family protein [Longimicrobium sp.]
MIGAIAGDVIGSVHEHSRKKSANFLLFDGRCRFTDDTVLTVATAWAILTDTPYGMAYHAFGRRYPFAGYGASFLEWLASPRPRPYHSWGNGSAMRVSPVGWAFDSREAVLREAERSAAVTHDHPEGIKGAQATALAVFLARSGAGKEEIRGELVWRFAYDLNRTVEQIRDGYEWDVSCQGSVPEAIVAFLDSTDFEDAIRLAVSLGGDADTQAAIAGGIAHAFYRHVPASIAVAVRGRLPAEFIDVIDQFDDRFV